MLTSIRPISANVTHRVSSSYLALEERPDINYRLGISTDTGLEGDAEPTRKASSLSFNLDSGVQLTQHFDVQGRYTRAVNDEDFRASKTRTLAVTWPDIQARWDALGNFRPLRPILDAGSLNLNYKASHSETGQRDQEPTTTRDALSMSPALDMTWKNSLQSTLSVAYTKDTNDTRGSKAVNTSTSVALDLKRDFRGGGGIGLFGKKMSWNNNLETSLSIAYTKSGGERSIGGGFLEPVPSSNSFRVSPTARYTFSKNINGSAFIEYSRSFTEATEQTTTSVRVGVTAVVTF
jgi:hypothetical protein